MTSYVYTRQALARRVHPCPRCGATTEVTLHAIGSTGAIPDEVDTLAAREAAMAAAVDADVRRALALVRCTACRERARWPVVFSVARVVAWFAAAPILPMIAPISLGVLWLIPAGLALGGLAQLARERARFRRVREALVVQLTAPTRDPAGPAKPARLPAARATRVPPIASPQPPPPETKPTTPAAAPPPPPPPAPAEPRFLTRTDDPERDPSRG